MNKFFGKLFFIVSGILSFGAAHADRNVTECEQRIYECACNPLYCGAWSVQVDAGVAPIIWRHRGQLDLLSTEVDPANPIFQVSPSLPRFRSLYRVPFIVGAKLGYAVTDNTEVYVEADYLQARHKHGSLGYAFPTIANAVPAQTLTLVLGKYKLFEAYVGARYYWDRWCDALSPFVGMKIGFTKHRNVSSALSLNGTIITTTPAANTCVTTAGNGSDFFLRNTVFAGGANVGLDYCIGCNWSVVFTAEVVACTGPRTQTVSVFATPLVGPTLATNLIVGTIETEVRFPITVGLKYSF